MVGDLLCAKSPSTVFHTASIQGLGYSHLMSKEMDDKKISKVSKPFK